MKINNLFESFRSNRISVGIFLILALMATLFPPFEWNHKITSIDRPNAYYQGSSEPIVITEQSTAIKSYEFLFGFNQRKFYSDVTKRNESFTRSIILSELLVEYLFISISTVFFHLILISKAKKKL